MCISSHRTGVSFAILFMLHAFNCTNQVQQAPTAALNHGVFPGGVLSGVNKLQHYVMPCRLHEALDLVKEMARSHRYMQAATLNSLVRALAPSSAPRALRMVSFMTTLGLPTYHMTSIALIGACARQHMSC